MRSLGTKLLNPKSNSKQHLTREKFNLISVMKGFVTGNILVGFETHVVPA